MTALDLVLPCPRKIEVDSVDLAAAPAEVWRRIRHGDLATSPTVHALFALRTLPGRLAGEPPAHVALRLDELVSTPERPGFQILADDAPREVVVGAIGKVWMADIPFVHVADWREFQYFRAPGYVHVAWAIRVMPLGERDARVEFELRVDATDDDAWAHFERYFKLIGPGSHFIRRSVMASLAREFGTPEGFERVRHLPGDERLRDAVDQVTDGITLRATPAAIWPWLVQMGCERAGFYGADLLDHDGRRSAREVHPELQDLRAGDVIAASSDGENAFEVLALDAPHALVLGALYDSNEDQRLPFDAPRPARYWHITWAFVLEALDATTTRLHVRARAAFPASEGLHAAWIRPVHRMMQRAQLHHLAARVEGRLARDDWRDVLEGVAGATVIALAVLTPFLRGARNHWGLTAEEAARPRPGDEHVPDPHWSWTHAIEVDAPSHEVWPWIAQIGADRGGFYSYQSLENLAGCGLRNAEAVHPEWAHREGDGLMLHPEVPLFRVASLVPGEHLVACLDDDGRARAAGGPWAAVSWLFQVEALGPSRCRVISRYRCACSDDLATRLALGPTFAEPVGFAMDRRMLLGIKARAESAGGDRAALAGLGTECAQTAAVARGTRG